MIRKMLVTAGCAVMLSMSAFGADLPDDTVPPALAREVVNKTIELVESKGVYPRQQSEYAQARSELLALLDAQGGIDRRDLYARISKLLRTLDADGHSIIIPAGKQLHVWRSPQAGALPPAFSLVATSHGKVLRWTPPPIIGSAALFAGYLARFYDDAAAHPELAQACALVVDLSEQTGGNAWPPLMAMYPLIGDVNAARWVDRDGKRGAVVERVGLEQMNQRYAPGRVNPLAPYASGPLAVLVGERTSSAGEMLLVALMGEDRVQTFGRMSQGLSTSNGTFELADGSTLVLTTARYALGDGPVYHGGIAPMHPAAAGEPLDASLGTAAEWVAANSPQCKASQPAVAQID